MTLVQLIEAVRKLPPMTERQRKEQALDFAYGQLAASTHHKPSRSVFLRIAREDGWTLQEFARWQKGRQWW